MESQVSQFLQDLAPDLTLWRSIDVRLVAVHAEGSWRNLATVIYLRPTPPRDTPRLRHQLGTNVARAEQHILQIAELESVLRCIEEGAWPNSSDRVAYLNFQFDGRGGSPYVFSSEQLRSIEYAHVRAEQEWTAFVLSAEGESTGTILNRVPGAYDALDQIARHHRHPFARFGALAGYVLERPFVPGATNAWCYVIAPYEVRIDTEATRIEEDVLHYEILAGARSITRRARLQVLLDPPDGAAPASSVLPKRPRWSEARGRWRFIGEVSTKGAQGVNLALHCGSQTVHWFGLQAYLEAGEPAQVAIYRTIDPQLAILARWLCGEASKKGKPQDRFEEAVGRVFMLGGWHVDVLRGGQLGDAVDVLAHNQGRHLCAAIECTIGPLDVNKLSKLAARVSALCDAISGVNVRGIAATSLRHAALLPASVQAAGEVGILVLPRERLLELLEMVNNGAGPTATLAFLDRLEGTVAGAELGISGA